LERKHPSSELVPEEQRREGEKRGEQGGMKK
jgi:hypothetical protein